jgi:signal peptide peptidase SppA
MRSFLPHVASRVFGSPLLIQPRKLDVILRVLGPRIGLSGKAILPDDDEDDPTDRNPYTVTPDGIAVISVAGSLVRKSSFMDAYSGLTSYAAIETEFLDAVTNPSVKGILLDIDSPGGECAGCMDLSDEIYKQRGSKPIYAIANESMFSAAYALGSAADKIYVTRTGGVGSIGVICLHVDQSGMDAQEGLKFTPIYAGDHKNDFTPHEPLADDVRNEMQAEVDRLYLMFVDTVARNRGISTQRVKDTQAALFWGPDAVKSGLADSAGNIGDALGALASVLPTVTAPQRVISIAGTSVAANSEQKEVTFVSENNQVADQIPATQPEPAAVAPQPAPVASTTTIPAASTVTYSLAAAPAAPKPYSHEDSVDVMHLCEVTGQSLSRATQFVSARMSYSDVLKVLSAEREHVSAQAETTSAVMPATSTQTAEPRTNPLLAAVEAINERSKNKAVYGGRS